VSESFWSSSGSGAAGGFLAAFLVNAIQNWWTTRAARIRLLEALRAEAETAIYAVTPIVRAVEETLDHAATLRDLIEAGTRPEFAQITKLYAGWVVYAPDYPVLDISLKLKGKEIELSIQYFDRWARLVEIERRYAAAHAALLHSVRNPLPCIEMTETAHQIHGYLDDMGKVGGELIMQAERLRRQVSASLGRPLNVLDL
jgi:hypothetical protein